MGMPLGFSIRSGRSFYLKKKDRKFQLSLFFFFDFFDKASMVLA
jgi:hypothetical protein